MFLIIITNGRPEFGETRAQVDTDNETRPLQRRRVLFTRSGNVPGRRGTGFARDGSEKIRNLRHVRLAKSRFYGRLL